MNIEFEILSEIRDIEVIAIGSRIRDLEYLMKIHGRGRWRKLKGIAEVRLLNGKLYTAELHWYQAHGIGRRDVKIKRYLE